MSSRDLEFQIIGMISALKNTQDGFSDTFLASMKALMPNVVQQTSQPVYTPSERVLRELEDMQSEIQRLQIEQTQLSNNREFVHQEMGRLYKRQAEILEEEESLLAKRHKLESKKLELHQTLVTGKKAVPATSSVSSFTMTSSPPTMSSTRLAKHDSTPVKRQTTMKMSTVTVNKNSVKSVKKLDLSSVRNTSSFRRAVHRRQHSDLHMPRDRGSFRMSLAGSGLVSLEDDLNEVSTENLSSEIDNKGQIAVTISNAGSAIVNGVYHFYEAGVFTHETKGNIELHHDLENNIWNLIDLETDANFYYAIGEDGLDMPPTQGWHEIDGIPDIPTITITGHGKLVTTEKDEDLVTLEPEDICVVVDEAGSDDVNGTYHFTELGVYAKHTGKEYELHHDIENHIWIFLNLDTDDNYYYVPGEDGSNLPPTSGWDSIDGKKPIPTIHVMGTKFVDT